MLKSKSSGFWWKIANQAVARINFLRMNMPWHSIHLLCTQPPYTKGKQIGWQRRLYFQLIPKVSMIVDTSGVKLPTAVAHRCPKDECADKKLFSCYGFAGKGRCFATHSNKKRTEPKSFVFMLWGGQFFPKSIRKSGSVLKRGGGC